MKSVMGLKQTRIERRIAWFLERLTEPATRLAHSPEEGGYWWVPIPIQEAVIPAQCTKSVNLKPNGVAWRLLALTASEFESVPGETLHPARWPEVATALQKIWGKPRLAARLAGCQNGLPRGRVSINVEGGYTIDHGNNNPPGTHMEVVAKAFGLMLIPPNRIDLYDPRFNHYDLDQEALGKFERCLRLPLGL